MKTLLNAFETIRHMTNKLPFENLKKEVITRKESITNPTLGIEPGKRPVEELINYGIVNIDKPKGPTK